MEFLFELIGEILFEGTIEMRQNKNVPKCVRIFFGILLFLFVMLIVGGLFFLGIMSYKENRTFAILLMIFSIALFIGFIIKFKHIYIDIKKKK